MTLNGEHWHAAAARELSAAASMRHRVDAFVLCAETELAKAAALTRFRLVAHVRVWGGAVPTDRTLERSVAEANIWRKT